MIGRNMADLRNQLTTVHNRPTAYLAFAQVTGSCPVSAGLLPLRV